MGTIAEKLSYLDETREKILTNIQALGGDLTEESTFRSYADALDEIWEEQGHVTGTGTELTLSTKKGKMKVDLSPSALEQETTSGKNVLPILDGEETYGGITCKIENGKITLSGTSITNYIWIKLTNGIAFFQGTPSPSNKPAWFSNQSITGETYSFSKIGTTKAFFYTTADGRNILFDENQQTNTIDLSSKILSDVLYYVGGSGTVLNETFYLQAVKGSTPDTDFEPYTYGSSPNPQYPQEIHTVSGENSVKVGNKNLAKSDWAEDFITAVNNTERARLETKDGRNCLFYVQNAGYGDYEHKNLSLGTTFKENTQYTLSYDILKIGGTERTVCFRYTDGTSTTNTDVAELNKWYHQSITSKANKTIAYICSYYTAGNTYIDINTWQIEEGTTETSYEEHKEQTYPISLGDLEYCKIGDYEDLFFKNVVGSTYYDSTLELDKWYLKKNIGKDTITGNVSSVGTASSGIKYALVKNVPNSVQNSYVICSKYINSGSASQNNAIRIANTTLYVYDNTFTSSQIASTSLNGLEYYYQLSTPTYTLLSDTLQTQLEAIWRANSYEEQTNISQENDDLPFVINAKALGIETESSTLSLNSLNTMSLNPRLDTEIVEPTVEEQEESVEEEE